METILQIQAKARELARQRLIDVLQAMSRGSQEPSQEEALVEALKDPAEVSPAAAYACHRLLCRGELNFTEELRGQIRRKRPQLLAAIADCARWDRAVRFRQLVLYTAGVFVPCCRDDFDLALEAALKLVRRAKSPSHRDVFGAGSAVLPAHVLSDPALMEGGQQRFRMVFLLPLFLSLAVFCPSIREASNDF